MKNFSYYFEPSYVVSPAKQIYTAIDGYEYLINKAAKENRLKEYIVDFLAGHNKKYHGEICAKWFRIALEKARPDMIEWFDRMQILK